MAIPAIKQIATVDDIKNLTTTQALKTLIDFENVKPLIATVRTESMSLVFDVEKKKDRESMGGEARKVAMKRNEITAAIDATIQPMKDYIQQVKVVSDQIVTEMNAIRDDILKPRVEWQKKQDEIEAKRVADIKERIENIRSLGNYGPNEDAESIGELLDTVSNMDLSKGFDEFLTDAITCQKEVTKKLNDRLIEIATEREREEREKELADLKAEQEYKDFLNNISKRPMTLIGYSKRDIKVEIENMILMKENPTGYDDHKAEIDATIDQAINLLKVLYGQAPEKELEPEQAEVPPESLSKTQLFSRVGKALDNASAVVTQNEAGVYVVSESYKGYVEGTRHYEIEADSADEARELYLNTTLVANDVEVDKTEVVSVEATLKMQ